MSKNIVSGAVALLMVLVPMSAGALTQIQIPSIPQHATIQQLLDLVVQLQGILQILLNTQPEQPTICPVYNAAICETGSHLVGGELLSNGCYGAPHCVPDSTNSVTVTSPNGGEQFVKGQTFSAKWKLTGLYPTGTKVCVNLTNQSTQVNNVPFYGTTGTEHCAPVDSSKSDQYGYITGQLAQGHQGDWLPNGTYKARAFTVQSQNVPYNPTLDVYDESDSPFTIVATSSPSGQPSVTGSAANSQVVNGVNPLVFSYDVNNAPSGSYITIELRGTKFPGGAYVIVSPYLLDGTTRSINLSSQQTSFPSHGTITFNIGTSNSYMPMEGPVRIKIMNAQGVQIATTDIPVTVIAPPTASPRITYTGLSGNTINAAYTDMPANSQVVIINQTSGARLDSVSTYIANAGSGAVSIPFPPGTPAGTYYLKAMNYSTQAYIAQTVSFTYAGTPAACPIYQQPLCPAGQHLVTSPSTRDSNNCEIPNVSCVADTAAALLSVASGNYIAGETVSVTYNNIGTPTVKDWIVFVPANQSYTQSNWPGGTVAPWAYANGSVHGGVSVKLPSTPGMYQAVYYRNDGFTEVVRSTYVAVSAATVTQPPLVPTPTASCTYTPTSSKYGDKSVPPGSLGVPSTITISGGQSACSAWCSSQAAEAYVYYTCAYNGAAISMGQSNISNIAFEGAPSSGTVAGVSISLDQQVLTDDMRMELLHTLDNLSAILNQIVREF